METDNVEEDKTKGYGTHICVCLYHEKLKPFASRRGQMFFVRFHKELKLTTMTNDLFYQRMKNDDNLTVS
jgi:hypothetical protein